MRNTDKHSDVAYPTIPGHSCIAPRYRSNRNNYELLQREAQRQGVSLAELIRRMVREHFAQCSAESDPLARLAGIAEGSGEPVGREHNRFLYGKTD